MESYFSALVIDARLENQVQRTIPFHFTLMNSAKHKIENLTERWEKGQFNDSENHDF
jgi:hypothetical protein